MAAVVAPSHHIHSIHGSFGPSFSAAGAAHSHAPTFSLTSSRARGLSILSARTASAAAYKPSASRASPIRFPTASSRRAAPPPPRAVAVAPTEDPFADATDVVPILSSRAARPSAPMISSRTRIPSHPPPPPPGLQSEKADRALAKGRLVASVLLSRASARPARRRPSSLGAGERPYVKSGLSRMVELEVMV